jgi:hypothetical protein
MAVMPTSGAAPAVEISTCSGLGAIDTASGTTISSAQEPSCTVGSACRMKP